MRGLLKSLTTLIDVMEVKPGPGRGRRWKYSNQAKSNKPLFSSLEMATAVC